MESTKIKSTTKTTDTPQEYIQMDEETNMLGTVPKYKPI